MAESASKGLDLDEQRALQIAKINANPLFKDLFSSVQSLKPKDASATQTVRQKPHRSEAPVPVRRSQRAAAQRQPKPVAVAVRTVLSKKVR